MTSFSSETPLSSDQLRELTTRTVAHLLAEPPQPLDEQGYALRVLRHRGRRSGTPHDTPLGVVRLGGAWFLVAPRRHRDWVRNLLAHPDCTVLAGNEAHPRHAVPVSGDEAAGVVAGYLNAVRAPWALKAFPVRPDASLADIAAHLSTMAVFRLDPLDGAV